MLEQSVQQNEQPFQELASRGATPPAPMVERAFRLLDLLSLSEEGLTLSEMARALEMSKSSIHGLLKTLEGCDVIEQVEERFYVLGPRIYDLAQAYVQRTGLRRFALPAMERLATTYGETVFLGRIEQEHVRIIESIEGHGEPPLFHITASRGTRVPLLAGAIGRVVLANWPMAQREAFLAHRPLPRFTAHSVTDPEQFLAAVSVTEQTGIGIDHEEYLTGVNAVAAPIYGPGKMLVALLWIVGFASRFDNAVMQRAAPQLLAEAAHISRLLGTQ
jgi:DNA-binding IclR family transcriptional regulator